MHKKKNIFVLSDATGETATHVLNSAMRQFSKKMINVTTFRMVSSPEKISKIVEMATNQKALIFFTFVYEQNRNFIKTLARQKNVLFVDILGDPINVLSEHLGVSPMHETTIGKRVTDDYFSRIEAMDFFLTHDDGIRFEDASQADIIIIGVSRSGKSPLSLYLAQKGYKVINIPFVNGVDMPEIQTNIDKRKIIALLIREERLYEIRKKRMEQYKYPDSKYTDIETIYQELEEFRKFIRKNGIKKIIDITYKAIEETAAEIIDYLDCVEYQSKVEEKL